MREIKFRAFLKERKVMREVMSIEFDDTGRKELVKVWDHASVSAAKIKSRVGTYFKDDVILVQFTGLKGKRGKEIYEGDIVTAPDILSNDVNANYEIKWNDVYARFMTWHNIGCCQFLYAFADNLIPRNATKDESELDTRTIEVVGNIYENPELLKDEVTDDDR